MAPVTEIVTVISKDGNTMSAAWTKAAEVLLSQPGCTAVRYSATVEEPSKVRAYIDWDDKSSHEAFTVTPVYNPFVADLSVSGTIEGYFHVEMCPFPPTVLDGTSSRVVEVLTAYFPADISATQHEAAERRLGEFITTLNSLDAPGKTGEYAYGWAVEDVEVRGQKVRALASFLGWESVEAHMAFRETGGFQKVIPLFRSVEGLQGYDMYHVKTTTVKRS